jgi:hypothetical protein
MLVVDEKVPMTWQKIMMIIAICKAAIGGAGLALALLGAYNVAAAVSALDFLHAVKQSYAFDLVAIAGGAIGGAVSVILKFVSR